MQWFMRHGDRPKSTRTELIRLSVRVVVFGGLSAIFLAWRANEPQNGNRVFLLVMALVTAGMGVIMVGQSVVDLRQLRRQPFPRSN